MAFYKKKAQRTFKRFSFAEKLAYYKKKAEDASDYAYRAKGDRDWARANYYISVCEEMEKKHRALTSEEKEHLAFKYPH